MSKRLVLVGLYKETNLGDPIIAYAVEWLFCSQLSVEQIFRIDLDPKLHPGYNFIFKALRVIGFQTERIRSALLYSYFDRYLSNDDFVVVVGGGLIKYRYQYEQLATPLIELLKVAQKKKISVAFNAIGVEGYDPMSTRCMCIKASITEAVKSGTLKYISTRDDIETLMKYIPCEYRSFCQKVADPAVWIADAFNIKRQTTNTVGIGVIRGNIFLDYGINFSSEALFELYVNLVKDLLKTGIASVELFTNGQFADNLFAKQIYQSLKGEGYCVSLKIPSSAEDLVRTISSYKGIVSARLHSCVVAYSLGVPFIGMVWNPKLKFFGENVVMNENFIDMEHLNVETLKRRLMHAMKNGCSQDQNYRNTIKQYIWKIGKKELM